MKRVKLIEPIKQLGISTFVLAGFLLAGNAHAVDFQFFVSNVMSGHDCPVSAPGCSADIVADSLTYSDGGIGVTVTSGAGTVVIADYAPAFGGLGALIEGQAEHSVTNPDNLVAGQSLTFNFDQEVQLFSAEHFNGSHQMSFGAGPDYELVVDGQSLGTFAINQGVVAFTNVVGTIFQFNAIDNGDPFYVSGLAVAAATAAMPEPGTALLLGLGFVGLGAARRRAA